MKYPWSELAKIDFGWFGQKWNQGDKLVMVMYDASSHEFGMFKQSYVDSFLKASPAGITMMQSRPEFMASKVIKECTAAISVKASKVVSSYQYQGTIHNRYQRRHYVLVIGVGFKQFDKAGYHTFDHRTDLKLVMSEPNSVIIDQVLTSRFPLLRRQPNLAVHHPVMLAS